MGAQQGKERPERTTSGAVGSLHSLTLASAANARPLKTSKTNSLRPARGDRSQAFNVFVEHNGEPALIFFNRRRLNPSIFGGGISPSLN